jgi:phospholipid/cholesterol/gamma-HCH transport system substrate-binding protein
MERTKRDTLLGIVFFGTLGFLLWATLNLTDMSLGEVPPLSVFFQDGGGAQLGTTVALLGMKVGKVSEIEVLPARPENQRVRMTLLLQQAVALRSDARIEVRDVGALGGKEVWIEPGKAPTPWPADQPLIGVAQPSAFDRLGNIADAKGPVGERLEDVLREIRDFFRNLNDPDKSIGRLITTRELYDEVLGTVQSFRRILKAVEDGDGFVGRIVSDRTMRDNAMQLFENLAQFTTRLNGTDGTLPRLFNDKELGDRFAQTLLDLQEIVADLREGRGPAGKLLRDPEIAQRLTTITENLDSLLRKVNDPEAGVLGALTSDPQSGRDLKGILASLREVVDKVNNGRGLLSVMINDEDLGIRLRRIFTQVSRALEDAREAAPIGSFVQVLMGAF